MKKEKLIPFILPLLLSVCFIYGFSWLQSFLTVLPYLIMLIFALATGLIQILLIKSSRVFKPVIIIKYALSFPVATFMTLMHLIVGPAGNPTALTWLIVIYSVTTIAMIPLCILELIFSNPLKANKATCS